MKINSLLSDLIIITSYAPWDIGKQDLASFESFLKKAQKLDSVSPALSVRAIKLIFELKELYLDIISKGIEKDTDTAFLFKLLNSTLSAVKKRNMKMAASLINQAQKWEKIIKTKKETSSSFVKNLKYDNIYLQLIRLIKTTGEIAVFLKEERL